MQQTQMLSFYRTLAQQSTAVLLHSCSRVSATACWMAALRQLGPPVCMLQRGAWLLNAQSLPRISVLLLSEDTICATKLRGSGRCNSTLALFLAGMCWLLLAGLTLRRPKRKTHLSGFVTGSTPDAALFPSRYYDSVIFSTFFKVIKDKIRISQAVPHIFSGFQICFKSSH